MGDSMLTKVNAAGLFTNKKQTIQTSDMVIDLQYVVIKIKHVNTRFGRSILIETNQGLIWLPKRMSECITDDWIDTYRPGTLALICKGFEKLSGKTNQTPKLMFAQVEVCYL